MGVMAPGATNTNDGDNSPAGHPPQPPLRVRLLLVACFRRLGTPRVALFPLDRAPGRPGPWRPARAGRRPNQQRSGRSCAVTRPAAAPSRRSGQRPRYAAQARWAYGTALRTTAGHLNMAAPQVTASAALASHVPRQQARPLQPRTQEPGTHCPPVFGLHHRRVITIVRILISFPRARGLARPEPPPPSPRARPPPPPPPPPPAGNAIVTGTALGAHAPSAKRWRTPYGPTPDPAGTTSGLRRRALGP